MMKKANLRLMAVAILAVLFFSVSAFARLYDGSGTEAEPFIIDSAEKMNDIGNNQADWGLHFKLMADIDLGGYTGTTYNIIGPSWGNKFTGVFDGNDHTIANFTYTTTGISNIGLFGVVSGTNAEIKNLRLTDPNVDGGTGYDDGLVGAMIGYIDEGIVENCHVEGGSISGAADIGGLIGLNINATITNCSSQQCIVSGRQEIGGLIGFNTGAISDCTSSCTVSGEELIGGLVGGSERGEMTNCSSSGEVTGTDWGAGGLAGYNWRYLDEGGIITNCHSSADVTGDDTVGGLVGSSYSIITNSFATGKVIGNEEVGGLAGSEDGTIQQCYATGDVEGAEMVGGFVGYSWPDLDGVLDCYAMGNVTGNISVGGLIGRNRSEPPKRCYSTGLVAGTTYVGGLIGRNDAGATNCFWDVITSGETTSAGGTGKITTEMQIESTFTSADWDFNTPVWKICYGPYYPRLLWEEDCPNSAPLLHDEPEVTLNTSNTIYWNLRPYDNEYFAECSTDPNFDNIYNIANWIFDNNCSFNDLEIGQTYWYRVKAKTFPAALSWMQSAQNDFETNQLDGVSTQTRPDEVVLAEHEISVVDELGGTALSSRLHIDGAVNFFHCTKNSALSEIRQYINVYTSGYHYYNARFVVYEALNKEGTYKKVFQKKIRNSRRNAYLISSGTISVSLHVGRYYAIGCAVSDTCTYYRNNSPADDEISWGSRCGSRSMGYGYPPPSTISYRASNTAYYQLLTTYQARSLPSGNCISTTIDLPDDGDWVNLTFNAASPNDTDLTVDVLDANDDSVILEDANDGEDLNWIDVDSIKLRANLSTDDPNVTPALHDWSVTYTDPTTIIESDWSNVVFSMQGTLGDAVDVMLDPNCLKNANQANALTNKIDEVLAMIDEGLYEDALAKLENDILKKTDGCANSGEPDKNDWITTCEGQDQVYPLVMETIEYVESLME